MIILAYDLKLKWEKENRIESHYHHQCLSHPFSGYRPQTTDFHLSLSWAFLAASLQLIFPLFMSSSTCLHQVICGLPLPLLPCGFHWSACLVMLLVGFLSVCPIHLHLRRPISLSIGSCSVLSHRILLWALSLHLIFIIRLKQVLMKTCSFEVKVFVRLQVSLPYKSTDLTFYWKSLIFVLIEMFRSFHTLFNNPNAARALPILVFISAPVPPLSSIMLPRYVNSETSSNWLPPTIIVSDPEVLTLRIFDFPVCILSPMVWDVSLRSFVLFCIWSWLCDNRAMSSAKSRSSSWFHRVHWIPFLFPLVTSFSSQSSARIDRKVITFYSKS